MQMLLWSGALYYRPRTNMLYFGENIAVLKLNESNKESVFTNTAKYKQERRSCINDTKRADGINKFIQKMEDDDVPVAQIQPIISLAHAMDNDTDNK